MATASVPATAAHDGQVQVWEDGCSLCAEPGIPPPAGAAVRYAVGSGVTRRMAPPPPPRNDLPLYRPLRIYTSDPSASRLDGATATVNVPYEVLHSGPAGRLFKVDTEDACTGERYAPTDLDAPLPLVSGGYDPSPSDPRFHHQMVYAVCCNVYSSFRAALGRDLAWGFGREADTGRLILRPHAFQGLNAYYDKAAGALCFGYDKAQDVRGAIRMLPGEYVFSCLSHDVVAHELTHAILDGLRCNFSVPSGPDVPAFHEAFADLVAIFQRLSYRDMVRSAIARGHGEPGQVAGLGELARQLSFAAGAGRGLRDAVDGNTLRQYDPALDAHALGNVLVAAVFDAFLIVFRRKTARYLRLATSGTGILPAGELPHELAELLAVRVSRLASQFLSLIIRAIDYCPPVDIRFGEFLRAMITADRELVPDDPWAYREALIDAFLRRGIVPRGVSTSSEQTLVWKPPRISLPLLAGLSFAELRFAGDPACAADPKELLRQADALGRCIVRPELANEFGLVLSDTPGIALAQPPVVESIRSARRIGPDGQIVFDLVAEVIQECRVQPEDGGPAYPVWGGSTVILDPNGALRYVISKSVAGAGRLKRRQDFLGSEAAARYWRNEQGEYQLKSSVLKSMCL